MIIKLSSQPLLHFILQPSWWSSASMPPSMWHWTCTNGGKNFDDATRKWQYNTYDGDVWHASEIDKSKCYTRAIRSC
jgi:hypothetical protein